MPNVVTLLGVPFDQESSFQLGAATGPPAIRAALRCESSNTWTEGGLDVAEPSVLIDAGDLDFTGLDPAAIRARIEAGVTEVLDAGSMPLVLGGDHSITYPVVRAMARRYPGLELLHFDAHGDLYDSYEGSRFSHACPFARIMEEKLARRLVQIGIRTLSRHQREQAERFGVEIHEMRDWTGPISLTFAGPLYISLDIDVLDPAFADGISHPEPGGLSVREVVAMIQRVRADRLVGADVVEFNPVNDASPRTGLVAAKFVKELADRLQQKDL